MTGEFVFDELAFESARELLDSLEAELIGKGVETWRRSSSWCSRAKCRRRSRRARRPSSGVHTARRATATRCARCCWGCAGSTPMP